MNPIRTPDEWNLLLGIPVRVSTHMAGLNKAVMQDGVLYVSPAMHSLMEGATPEELKHLFANLPILDLGNTWDFLKSPLPISFEWNGDEGIAP